MELLGLSEDELCRVLDADPLTLLSGQLDHRPEVPILRDLLAEAEERAGAPDNIKVLSCADLLTDSIRRIFTDDSVSDVFGGDNQLF